MRHFLYLIAAGLGCFPLSTLADSSDIFIIVNNSWRGRIAMQFTPAQLPCITASLLSEWGLHDDEAAKLAGNARCVTSAALASYHIAHFYDPDAQLLTLVIPPEQLTRRENGVVTSRWDDGITAAFVDYQLNYQHASGKDYQDDDRQHTLYIGLTQGLNLGAWRFRYQPVYQQESVGDPHWHTERIVAYRSLKRWRALLSLGDGTTSSDIFDSLDFRGFNLKSDDRMLPDGFRPFSPWIRGFAQGNAQVKIRQNGAIIYQTFVAPGAFVLKDIYPADNSGDIEMTITESDGSETVRILPWASMPNLVHYQHLKYDVTAGRYRPWFGSTEPEPFFLQGSLSAGVADKTTLYGGFQTAEIYRSGVVGVGRELDRLGALSVDYSFAQASNPVRARADRGGSARARYAIAFPEWESSLGLLLQYFPKQRYRTLNSAIGQQTFYWWDWYEGEFIGEAAAEKKTHLEARFNHYLSEEESLTFTLVTETLRGKKKGSTRLDVGYSGSWQGVDYTLYAGYQKPDWGKEQAQLAFTFSLPLTWLQQPHTKLNLETLTAKNGQSSRSLGLSGTALKDYNLSYNLSTRQQAQEGSSHDLSADYQYHAGDVRLGYSQGRRYRQQSADLTGSVLVSGQGIATGQTLGETVAIVSVPDTPGIGVDNQFGTTTDGRGLAIVSNLTPYRVNRISLSQGDLTDNQAMPESENEVVPTAGAIMLSRFPPPLLKAEEVQP